MFDAFLGKLFKFCLEIIFKLMNPFSKIPVISDKMRAYRALANIVVCGVAQPMERH